MSEELFVRCCAPTLASIKTGNLFTCRFSSRQQLLGDLRRLNRRLGRKGLRVVPLRYQEKVGLIYVYRPSRLGQDWQDPTARRLLTERGYGCENPNRCVLHLMQRLAAGDGFPHEIGLFLGYPPEDVEGFISRKAKAKCVGCWTVYGDEASARRTFALYQKCTRLYLNQWARGRNIERLAVAM